MGSETEIVIEEENNKVFGIKGSISYIGQEGGDYKIYKIKNSNQTIKYRHYDPKSKFKFGEGERHCDAIVEFFIGNAVKIVFVELKGNHVEDAIEQLQSTIRKLRKEYRERGIRWENLSKIAIVVSNSGIAPTSGLHRRKREKDIIAEGIKVKIKAQEAYLKAEDLVKCIFTIA